MGGPSIGGTSGQSMSDWTVMADDDFTVVESEPGQPGGVEATEDVHGGDDPGAVDDVAHKLESGELKGTDLVKGAKVERASDQAKDLAATAAKRSGGKEFFSAIGRFLMNAAHAVKSVVTLDVFRPSWWRNDVVHFDLVSMQRTAGLKSADIALPADDGTPPVPFDKHLVAAGTGFGAKIDAQTGEVGAKIEIKPFKEQSLYPKGGNPRLMDIVQNPKLQDCWFLSGITAMLSAKGPEAIKQLITLNEREGTCDVRLGEKHYTVPFGEVQVNGKSCVSDSAPWVKILEQAAAMRMATESKGDIIYKQMSTSFWYLSGGRQPTTPYDSRDITVDVLAKAIEKHVPVEIGHAGGPGIGVGQKLVGGLRDNISPGHAVTLLDVQKRGGGKAWLTVMDPYGRTRIISSSAIKRCSFVFGCDDDQFDVLNGREPDVEKLDEDEPPDMGPSKYFRDDDEDDF